MDNENKQGAAEPSPASDGSVEWQASGDADRRLAARLHGIADHSMAIIIGNMIQEMITELQMRKSPGYPGHISFTLTDEERWAVTVAMGIINERNYGWPDGTTPPQDTLRGLLKRTK